MSTAQVEMMPNEPQQIERLVEKLRDIKQGFRVSFILTGKPIQKMQLRTSVAEMIGFVPIGNLKKVRDAFRALNFYQKEQNGYVVGCAAQVTTWVDAVERFDTVKKTRYLNVSELTQHTNSVISKLQSWGMKVSEGIPDNLDAIIKGCSGLNIYPTAPMHPMPMPEVMDKLPNMRPGSQWKNGSTLLLSKDGKIMPFQPLSTKQSSWVNIFCGPMGFGKSVTMGSMDLDFLLTPSGSNQLPLIKGIDIGYTQRGFVDIVRSALPKDKKNMAVHVAYEETARTASNPLDTLVGQRYPDSTTRIFISNFIETLLSEIVNSKDAPPTISALIKRAVQLAYAEADDKDDSPTAKRYRPGENTSVDAAIKRHDLHADTTTPWWHVVDMLAEKGDFTSATKATSHAVPLLKDVALACNSPNIRNEFKEEYAGGLLNEFVTRLLMNAIDDFPQLSRPTTVSFGEARIAIIDMTAVIKSGNSPEVVKRNAVNYFLIANLLCRDFLLNTELASSPDIVGDTYRKFLMSKAQELLDTPKKWKDDEWHRFGSVPGAAANKSLITREGRKNQMGMDTGSQSLFDYSEDVRGLSSVFFCGVSGANEAKNVQESLGLSNSETAILERISAPNAEKGAELLLYLNNIKGEGYSKVSYHTFLRSGPTRLWALSSHAYDRRLRGLLYARLGDYEARKALVTRFPSGTCTNYVEDRLNEMTDVGDGQDLGLVNELAEEICAQHMKNKEQPKIGTAA